MNHADLEPLLILQEKDVRIVKLKKTLAGLPEQRARLAKQMELVKQKVHALKQEIVGLDREIKEVEGKIEERRAYIIKMRTLQGSTRKNEEYQWCIQEAEKAAATIDALETTELELMDKIEASKIELDAKVEKAKAAQREVEEKLAEFDHAEQADRQRLTDMMAEREQLSAKVSELSLGEYQRMIKSKGVPVIVTMTENGHCSACHMVVTEDARVRVQGGHEIVYCSSCHRVLY